MTIWLAPQRSEPQRLKREPWGLGAARTRAPWGARLLELPYADRPHLEHGRAVAKTVCSVSMVPSRARKQYPGRVHRSVVAPPDRGLTTALQIGGLCGGERIVLRWRAVVGMTKWRVFAA